MTAMHSGVQERKHGMMGRVAPSMQWCLDCMYQAAVFWPLQHQFSYLWLEN